MNKHKCGTCRFYQEARLASSGWCHHPLRKTTSDLMIMVRKNEIACRDEWDHHLWQPRSDPSNQSTAQPFGEPFPDRKMLPATESEIAAILLSEKPPTGTSRDAPDTSGPDDIVLSELGVDPAPAKYADRAQPVRDWAAPQSRPVEPLSSGPHASEVGGRNAVLRAREAFRERSRLVAARSNEIARLAAEAESERPAAAPPLGNHELDPERVDAASTGALQTPDSRNSAQSDHTVSLIATDEQGERAEAPAHPHDPESDNDHDVIRQSANAFAESPPPATGNRQPWEASHSETPSGAAPVWLEDDLDRASPSYPAPRENVYAERAPNAEDDASSSDPSSSLDLDWLGEYAPPTTPQRSVSDSSIADAVELSLDETWADDVAYDNIDQAGSDQSTRRSLAPGSEQDSDAAPEGFSGDNFRHGLVVADDDTVDEGRSLAGAELSAHLQRICRNCRDFRPSESVDRGWCANQWAFSHRRVVDAHEQTPCEGTLGNWWLPIDEVWSEAADVSSHGQPTPLLDSWLPHHLEGERTRRRS